MANNLMVIDEKIKGGCFCSIPLDSEENKKLIYNCATGESKKLRECINTKIRMKHLYIEQVELEKTDENNNKTGEFETVLRTIIIDDKNDSYSSCSKGVYNALKRIVSLYGLPTEWDKPVEVMPLLISAGKNQVVSLKLV